MISPPSFPISSMCVCLFSCLLHAAKPFSCLFFCSFLFVSLYAFQRLIISSVNSVCVASFGPPSFLLSCRIFVLLPVLLYPLFFSSFPSVQVPKRPTERTAQLQIVNLLHLKRTLSSVPDIQKVLSACESPLLVAICENLANPCCESLKAQIDKVRMFLLFLLRTSFHPFSTCSLRFSPHSQVISQDASLTSKQSEQLRAQVLRCFFSAFLFSLLVFSSHSFLCPVCAFTLMQLVFSIKSGISGLLDVARATFLEAVEEIHTEFEKYKKMLGDPPEMKLAFNVSRGYHISLPQSTLEKLPKNIFIQVVHSGKRILCSTDDLCSLDGGQRAAIILPSFHPSILPSFLPLSLFCLFAASL